MRNPTVGVEVFYFIIGAIFLFHGALWAEYSPDRQTPADLERELKILEMDGTADSEDLSRLLRLASLYLDLGYGMYVDREKKLSAFQAGARVAKKALQLRESSADAHFLYAANLGSIAELEGLVTAALTIKQLRNHVNRVLELDEQYVPAHHMLGRMYEELPWILGGNQKAAEEHLKTAVSLDVRYAPARLDLARWYMKRGKNTEAMRELTQVIEMPPFTKRWIWERVHRPEAQALLQEIKTQEASGRFPVNP